MNDYARLWIPGPMPGLNELIDARMLRKGKWNGYSSLKKKWGQTIGLMARTQGFTRVESGLFTYLIDEPNQRRDPLNIVAGAVKLIEDGLQEAGLLGNDGWSQVLEIRPYWRLDKQKPGVSLFVTQDETLTFAEACYLESQPFTRKSA